MSARLTDAEREALTPVLWTETARARMLAAVESILAAREARIRSEIVAAILEHADHMQGYTLPSLSVYKGYDHALRLLRRDAGFIADRAVREHLTGGAS